MSVLHRILPTLSVSLTIVLLGCGGGREAEANQVTPEVETASADPVAQDPGATPSETEAGAEPEAEPEPEPESEPIDLLHAVQSEVAVSSTYRIRGRQAEFLVAGVAETAWNSESGQLVGSWMAFRVPTGAEVTESQMNVGYIETTLERAAEATSPC